jgi:hypothetical protein
MIADAPYHSRELPGWLAARHPAARIGEAVRPYALDKAACKRCNTVEHTLRRFKEFRRLAILLRLT